VRFATHPSPLSWYLAHDVTIVSAYLEHRDLAEGRTVSSGSSSTWC